MAALELYTDEPQAGWNQSIYCKTSVRVHKTSVKCNYKGVKLVPTVSI